jgi:hypothetical protein
MPHLRHARPDRKLKFFSNPQRKKALIPAPFFFVAASLHIEVSTLLSFPSLEF